MSIQAVIRFVNTSKVAMMHTAMLIKSAIRRTCFLLNVSPNIPKAIPIGASGAADATPTICVKNVESVILRTVNPVVRSHIHLAIWVNKTEKRKFR